MVADFRQQLGADADGQRSLRDSLVSMLRDRYARGPRVIRTQLCLAVAGLALQMLDNWPDAVAHMMRAFGANQGGDGQLVLLEFLTVLPEEVRGNSRIPVAVRAVCSWCVCM